MVVARKFGAELYVSASSLRQLEDCPRAWYYRYMIGAPPEDISARMVLGLAVHVALSEFYAALRDHRPEPSLPNMIAAAAEHIQRAAAGPTPLLFDGENDAEALRAEAARVLRAFSDHAYRPAKVLGVEQAFTVPLGHHPETGEVLPAEEQIGGVFDLVVETEVGVQIVDHKVRARASPEGQPDMQMLLYVHAARHLFPATETVSIHHQNLVTTKAVRVELQELLYREQDMSEAFESVASGIEMIHVAVGHSSPRRLLGRRRSWKCPTCGFRARCAIDRG